MNQTWSDNLYFAEDDYLYADTRFSDMLDVIKRDNVDFVTPYDHPDYYQEEVTGERPSHIDDLHGYKSEIIFQNRHWRTVSSTTCTFLTTKRRLRNTLEYMKLYPKISDYGMWIALTKKKKKHYNYFKTLQLYKELGFQMLLGNSYKLWSPMPSIATHMEEKYLSKGLDWEKRADEIMGR